MPLKLPAALKGNQMDIEINITADFTKPGVAAGTKSHSIAGCVLACAPAQSFPVHQPVFAAGFGMTVSKLLASLTSKLSNVLTAFVLLPAQDCL